ncbi:MAG: hypothetical protein LBM78_03520, partial [Clostridiales bacterium]|nr:hypothetical protein [Clostridiales bacterium]
DNLAYAGGLSPSQIISLILLGVGGVLLALYLLHLKGKIKIPFFPPVENAEAVAVTPQDAE